MTEQPRTIDRDRLRAIVERVDDATTTAIDVWLKDFLASPSQTAPLPPRAWRTI